MTGIDRRSFLAALGATVASGFYPRRGHALAERPLFVSACFAGDGKSASVAVFSLDGEMLFSTRLPERGHDIAIRPASSDLVVFARRPGNWAAVVDRTSGTVRRVVTAPEGRHFYGHGVFSADGGLLYATENDIAKGDGLLGIYDARNGYARVGEMPSFGIGPHDLAYLPGHRTIVVANGGIRTNPETGREILNRDRMEPSLAIVDPVAGTVLLKVDLGPDLRGLSIRHLAVTPRGETVFGCQFEGDEAEMPPLVGVLMPDGRTRFLDMPEDALDAMKNYVGSVTLDASGRIAAAASPVGNTLAFWDLDAGRFIGRRRMSDVCGIAPAPVEGVFLATSGNAGVRLAPVSGNDLKPLGGTDLARWAWDNHLRAL
ncbi:DUF1513 domain-containing protein [Microvirga thermotolerans]|uniref:DUF1513 domain-containing protein n=1 Tax=Microvirga thermotolerans TaxID=2651334 RepID=A0A5P9JYC9_9HYPH|nr:DUF1513 domain-containing protein [Microvirga thermotolerans]QFU16758.1 DUF1513 domain-containing protein [Microvirga thermotolerans]